MACSWRASSAARAARIVIAGPMIPDSARLAARMSPAGQWTIMMPATVPALTAAAIAMGR